MPPCRYSKRCNTTLDVEIAKLRAVAEAGRPTVAIAYEPQAPIITLDGSPLSVDQICAACSESWLPGRITQRIGG